MTKVYFFSRHTASPEMIAHLGGTITQQFTGTITGIRRVGDSIVFSEISLDNYAKVQETYEHTIPADSIVVAVTPLPLQIQWLNAGVQTLLVPQTKREVVNGNTVFSYTGLIRMKGIIIDSEQWAGATPTVEQKHAERSAM